MFIDEFPFARFMKGEARFKYGTNAIRLDLSNKVVDNLFPVAMYDRVEFNMSTGGNVVVIFLNPIHKELRDAIANIPDPISSYDQLEPLKEGLIISYGTWEMSGLDWVDGYEWSGFKEGRLREQLSPEQIPPSFRKKI